MSESITGAIAAETYGASSTVETDQWQPIATAPKDGRTIEVCDVMHQETNMIVGWDTHAEKRNDKYSWTTGDMNYHKDVFTHWKEITPQPKPPTGDKPD